MSPAMLAQGVADTLDGTYDADVAAYYHARPVGSVVFLSYDPDAGSTVHYRLTIEKIQEPRL